MQFTIEQARKYAGFTQEQMGKSDRSPPKYVHKDRKRLHGSDGSSNKYDFRCDGNPHREFYFRPELHKSRIIGGRW